MFFFLIQQVLNTRIRNFYSKFDFPTPNRNAIKKEAKLAKAFMVLVKRKLQREQVCRSPAFRTLQALVFKDAVPDFLEEGCCNLHVYGCYDVLWFSVVKVVPSERVSVHHHCSKS